jgi:hypothetical protein
MTTRVSTTPHVSEWKPLEERIYGHYYFFCRSLRIKPVRFDRWLRLSEGRGRYDENSDSSPFLC